MSLQSFITALGQYVGANEFFDLEPYKKDPDVNWIFRTFIQEYPIVYRVWGNYLERHLGIRKGVATTKSKKAIPGLIADDTDYVVTEHHNVLGCEPVSILKSALYNNWIADPELKKYIQDIIFQYEEQREVLLLTPVVLQEKDIVAFENKDGELEWL